MNRVELRIAIGTVLESIVIVALTAPILGDIIFSKLAHRVLIVLALNNNSVVIPVVASTKILFPVGFFNDVQCGKHGVIVSILRCRVNGLLGIIRNHLNSQESCAIAFRIRKTKNLIGLLSILNDDTHIGITKLRGIDNDCLDLSTDQGLEGLLVVIHGAYCIRFVL
jgi:hypothetical protein